MIETGSGISRRDLLLFPGRAMVVLALKELLLGQGSVVSAEAPPDLELQTELKRCQGIIEKNNKSGVLKGNLVEFRRAGVNEKGAIEVSLSRQGSFSSDKDYYIFSGPSLSPKDALLKVKNTEYPRPVSENSSPAFYVKAKWTNDWVADFYGYKVADLDPVLKEKFKTDQLFVYFCVRNDGRLNFQPVVAPKEPENSAAVKKATLEVTIDQAFKRYRSGVKNLTIGISPTVNVFGKPETFKVIARRGVMIRSLPLVLEQNNQGALTYGEEFRSPTKITLQYEIDGHKHYEVWVVKDKENNFVCLYENEKDQEGNDVELGQYVR